MEVNFTVPGWHKINGKLTYITIIDDKLIINGREIPY